MGNITVRLDGYKLNVRTAAIISYEDKFLFAKTDTNEYHGLVGGRVEIGEDSFTSIVRELEEEIGEFKLKKDIKLINISENFFMFKGEKVHEILFIFKVELDECELTKKNSFTMLDKETTKLKWIDKDDIENIWIQPKMVKKILYKKEFTHNIINELED